MSLTSHQRQVRGASDVWLTPPEILAKLGEFDLDPCAAPEPRPWATAKAHITLPDDGLAAEWPERCSVWCNPPFGPEAQAWLERCARHAIRAYGNGSAVCLVPARTETRWFVSEVWGKADAVLFLHGRPHFHHPDGSKAKNNSGAPICLIAYGTDAVERLWCAEGLGTLCRTPRGWVS